MVEMDATAQVDQILASYQPVALTIWITLAVIVVALIALGTEFWANLWGCIFYPSMTFQRLLGEAQAVPGLVVVAISGLASAAIFLSYISDQKLTEWFAGIDIETTPVLSGILTSLDDILTQVGWDKSLIQIFKFMQENAFQAQTVAVVVPLAFLVLWVIWGVAGQLASMIAGNKAGHGIANLWAAAPYAFLIWILSMWCFLVSKYDHGFMRILFWLSFLYFLFEHVVLMREHGRYKIQSAIMATILTLILVAAFVYILVILGIFIYVQVITYV